MFKIASRPFGAYTLYELNDDVYGNIMIAVVESVNNAIIHGNKTDKEKNVSMCLDRPKTRCHLSIK